MSESIVVLGSINADLVAHVAHLPAPGETILATGTSTAPGGKGGNQAVAAARAGASVTFMGAVGSDTAGTTLTAHLRAEGVDTGLLRTVDGPSGQALITVDDAGENTIVVLPGANGTVDALRDTDRRAISGAALLVCQLEIPMAAVLAGVRCAARSEVPVLLNPSPVRDLPEELVEAVTVLVVNRGEADALGADLLARVPHVITTLGGEGARYRGPGGSVFELSAPAVQVVDTTGAGDAFTGALAQAWADGADPHAALARACAAGALATTVTGAGISAPTRAAIDELVAATS